MKKIIVFSVFCLLGFAACFSPVTTGTFAVHQVIDGDTFEILINGKPQRVRIIGINTPETVDPRKPVQCFGPEASHEAKSILTDKTVRLEADQAVDDHDQYGRLLRYVFLPDGSDYGKMMISQGFAREYTFRVAYQFQSEYKEAQKIAKGFKMGVWGVKGCARS